MKRLPFLSFLALPGVTLLLGVGCSGSAGTSNTTTNGYQALQATVQPANGATLIQPNTQVVVQFNNPVHAPSVNVGSFQLLDQLGQSVPGTVSYVGSMVVFTPTHALSGSTPYTVSLGNQIVDQSGNKLKATQTTFTTAAGPSIFFNGPGTGAPAAMLGSFTMTPFPQDSSPYNTWSSGVLSPVSTGLGSLSFNEPLLHLTVLVWSGLSTAWGHGYTTDVYSTSSSSNHHSLTISLPMNTGAFYLYATPEVWGTVSFTAMGGDGVSSGPIPVTTTYVGGSEYFGFYSSGNTLSTITISNDPNQPFNFAIGEFGIAPLQ